MMVEPAAASRTWTTRRPRSLTWRTAAYLLELEPRVTHYEVSGGADGPPHAPGAAGRRSVEVALALSTGRAQLDRRFSPGARSRRGGIAKSCT